MTQKELYSRLKKVPGLVNVVRFTRKLPYYRIMNKRDLFAHPEKDHLRQLFLKLNVDCVFDVGGNNGQYAQMLRRHAKFRGRIITFEPIPRLANLLRAQAKNDPLWIIQECALSSVDGEVQFNVMAGDQFSSLGTPKHDEVNYFTSNNRPVDRITVKSETLQTAYKRLATEHNFHSPYLKMDTQGFDVAVFKSGIGILHKFVGLQSELAIDKLYEESVGYKEALGIYENEGFLLSAMVPNNAGYFPRLVELDCIMVRKDLL
jgi:FkbM family methyltransferase